MIPRRAADQVINSASSALYSIGLVWVTDDATLGAAAIALTAQPLLLGVLRTAVSEGLLMRARTDDDHESVAWIPAAAGVAAGVLGALVTFAVGLAVGLTSSTAGALAAVTLGVLVVDGLRFTAFLAGNDGRALTADAIWLGLSGLGLAVDIRSGGVGLGALSCWYAIGSFAASISLAPILQTIRRGPLPQWVRKEARFGADFVLQAVPGQATLILASAVASFAAVGQLRAAVTLYNPLTTALYALRLTILDRLAPGRRLAIIYGGAAAVYSGLLVTSFHFVPQLTSRPLGAISLAMLVYTGAG